MFIRKHHQHHGVDIALAHVVSAKHIKGGFEIKDLLGDTYHVPDLDWKIALQAMPVATWPALPGTYLLDRDEQDGKEPELTRQTVIAWATYADSETRPIVTDAETMVHRADDWVVEMPDGRVEGRSLSQWANANDWLAGKEI